MAAFESEHLHIVARLRNTISESTMHFHLCSGCGAANTVDRGIKCLSNGDHDDGLCEPCAFAQPSADEYV
jgi:hypothetical protein